MIGAALATSTLVCVHSVLEDMLTNSTKAFPSLGCVHIAVFRLTLGDVIGRRYQIILSVSTYLKKTLKFICAHLYRKNFVLWLENVFRNLLHSSLAILWIPDEALSVCSTAGKTAQQKCQTKVNFNIYIFLNGLALLRRNNMVEACCQTWVGRGRSNLTLGDQFTA